FYARDVRHHSWTYHIDTQMTEKPGEPAEGKPTPTVVTITAPPAIGINIDDKPMHARDAEINAALEHLTKVTMQLFVDGYGNLMDSTVAVDKAPSDAQKSLSKIGAQLCQSMDFTSITFPNTTVHPGQRWQGERQIPMVSLEDEIATNVPVVYTFLGV